MPMTTVVSAQIAAPVAAADRDWISVRGTVVSTQPDSFRLDYGKGIIAVVVPDAADEEAVGLWPQTDIQLGRIAVNGRIASISGTLVELDTGASGKVTIDVSQLGYNALDDEGFQQLDIGDRIRVIGRLQSAYFAANSLVAERVVSLQKLGPHAG